MAKLPTKQIYLLMIIVVGLVALSVYSTYAIFTYESETSEIVSIYTPNSLEVSTDSYEYKQLTVSKNSYTSADIDIYNTNDETICYSIWYKPVTEATKVRVYQNTLESLETSGTIDMLGNKRISLIVANDSDSDIKVNIGVFYSTSADTCSLNISSDKLTITSTIANPKALSEELIKSAQNVQEAAGYLTYKNITEKIALSDDEPIYISKTFEYKDELFTLTNYEEVNSKDIANYQSNDTDNYYTCLDKETCQFLYQIVAISESEEIKKLPDDKEEIIKHYHLTKYNLLKGYLAGENGLRKINNNYAYFGDNPHNFIYYNCLNELDNSTCELWRIIGFTYDEENKKYLTQIIKDDGVVKLKYADEKQTWNDSHIQKYLTKEYKLHSTVGLKEMTFKQENLTDLNSKISFLTSENKTMITIINLSDYLNASICENREVNNYDETCLKNNWLNKNEDNEWTNTAKYLEPYQDEETNELIEPANNTIYTVGLSIKDEKIQTELTIRPVVYLSSITFLTGGNGTIDNPYVIR